mmetsp:Transcript_5698/g.18636  ORF Transcript_5698/g.18636 Transcript_5698/m.18636 type:complete len:291 (+) Transcript_5698:924-1796(+)
MLVDGVALARLDHKEDHGVGAAVRAVRGGERVCDGVDRVVGWESIAEGEPGRAPSALPHGGAEGGPAGREVLVQVGDGAGEGGERGGDRVQLDLQQLGRCRGSPIGRLRLMEHVIRAEDTQACALRRPLGRHSEREPEQAPGEDVRCSRLPQRRLQPGQICGHRVDQPVERGRESARALQLGRRVLCWQQRKRSMDVGLRRSRLLVFRGRAHQQAVARRPPERLGHVAIDLRLRGLHEQRQPGLACRQRCIHRRTLGQRRGTEIGGWRGADEVIVDNCKRRWREQQGEQR